MKPLALSRLEWEVEGWMYKKETVREEWGGDLREKVENGEEEVKECPLPDGVVI